MYHVYVFEKTTGRRTPIQNLLQDKKTLQGASACSHPCFRSSTIFAIFLKKLFGPTGDPFIDNTDF